MKSLLAKNRVLLDQAISLIRDQQEEIYTRACTEVFSSSIGQHIRHCVEHYEEFLAALAEGRDLDYDKRPRDLRLETDPGEGIRRLAAIHASLGEISELSRSIEVLDECADAPLQSSSAREMQYLLSHTVHHFALIAVITTIGGGHVPTDFGIAPSTLKYRESA